MDEAGSQYLTFILEKEHFAIDVFKVREILEYTESTKVPNTADFVRGVINLRGNIVPVLDLRLKFGLPPTETTVDTCIIIVEINFNDEITLMGALADSVREVMEITDTEIEPPPKLGTRVNNELIHGMCKKEDQIIIILNVDKLFSSKEILEFDQISSTGNNV
jgi:purine-binding chemotaxis protein CheW